VEDLLITTTTLPGGTVDVSYSETLAATGGVTPYSWSICSGSLPAGLSLGSSTGTISGTPTSSGTSNFTVQVTDDQSPADSDTQALSIEITSGTQTEKTYQQGLDGYTGWDDAWITEDNPNTNYETLDSAHLQYNTQDRQLHLIDVSDIPSSATVDSATLKIYVWQASDTSTVSAYRIITDWDVSEVTYNNAKTGTSWGTAGMESGTDYASTAIDTSSSVTSAGWVSLDLKDLVQDWVDGTYPNRGVMLRLASGGHLRTRMADYATQADRPKLEVTYTTSGYDPVEITTTSLPDGQQGVSYSRTVSATGGKTPYTWSIDSGSLPAGLSLGSSTGTISGTPTSYGTSNFTVKVTDDQTTPDTDTQALSITVAPEDVEITTTSLPDGTKDTAYSETLAATGGDTPYTWSIYSGSLPSGLSLGSSTGTISGTPTSTGTSNFTVQVTDDWSPANTDTQALSITINAPQQYEKTYQQGLDSYGDWGSTHLQYYTEDRQLHAFDISDIPDTATIDEALLKIYVYEVSSGTPQISAYRIITSWVESEVTYNKADSSTNWATAGMASGTDYASTAAGTSASVSSAGWATIDITDLVQDWVDGTYTNKGVVLKLTTAGHLKTRMSEYSTTSYRPKLEVTYTN